ncbi:MBL fold metallo-hydrolase [Vagococcus xieshaowenii]|uniref:MBL fold metallo-hydrolase n=1 Tax=Vagococcus xieshaowenii TaxID=2562451 RepID=A0AAJ5EE30_9ENTE|nr:MBL fold metallo-hydrolase [Vagococcus xieshaowenii]QCA29555.1 MBL fold metallo-hydrolase [Vagococcus xieshaowenii]TFZ39465.1 MBL fold metallo-hydrolase [Vagococcus xieshaowenii]
MYVSVLASGSTGNCVYVETPEKKMIVDAGLSGKKITSLLAEIDRTPDELDAIFVTHEHTDHIKGVGILSRKYGIDIYANELTWQAMAKNIGNIALDHRHLFEMGKTLTFGDIDVESFGVSHDAAAPQFYQFHRNNKAFAVLTDTGYCSDRIKGTIKNADAYVIESNHDVEMLRMGNYPWHLKQRILGDKGHLSNEDGALVMTELIGDKTKKLFLGHLSRENNIKELAHMTMNHTLQVHDIDTIKKVQLYDTDPDYATALFAI